MVDDQNCFHYCFVMTNGEACRYMIKTFQNVHGYQMILNEKLKGECRMLPAANGYTNSGAGQVTSCVDIIHEATIYLP